MGLAVGIHKKRSVGDCVMADPKNYCVRWLHNGVLLRESDPMTKEQAEEFAAELNRRSHIHKATVHRGEEDPEN
jgi:hypothetical protein